MFLKCRHWKTYCCKNRPQKCLESQVKTNLARTPKSRIFLKRFCKGKTKEIRGLKNTPVQIALSPNHYLLEVQISENILLLKGAPKVPDLTRIPESRILGDFAKGGSLLRLTHSPIRKMWKPSLADLHNARGFDSKCFVALRCTIFCSVVVCVAVFCYVALCCPLFRHLVLYCAMLFYVAPCCAMLSYVVLCFAMLFSLV